MGRSVQCAVQGGHQSTGRTTRSHHAATTNSDYPNSFREGIVDSNVVSGSEAEVTQGKTLYTPGFY